LETHLSEIQEYLSRTGGRAEDFCPAGSITHWVQRKLLRSFSCCYNYRSCVKIKQEAAATSLSFTESFFVSRKQRTEFKKPTTGYCFACESEFTRAGNFQTKDNSTVKIFFSSNSSECQANKPLKRRKSWSHEKHLTYCPLNEYVDTCSTIVILAW